MPAKKEQQQLWDRLMAVNVALHGTLCSVNELPRGRLARDLLQRAEPDTREAHHQGHSLAKTWQL
jgi:hypothetical protein